MQKPLPALGFDIWSSAGNVEPLILPVARMQKPLPALGFDIWSSAGNVEPLIPPVARP